MFNTVELKDCSGGNTLYIIYLLFIFLISLLYSSSTSDGQTLCYCKVGLPIWTEILRSRSHAKVEY